MLPLKRCKCGRSVSWSKTGVLLVIATFSAVALAQTANGCGELDAGTKETALRNAGRKLNLDPSVLVLDREVVVPGSCYRQLFLSANAQRQRWTMYLSPEKRFLLLGLIDLAIDPEESDRANSELLERIIIEGRLPQRGPRSAPVTAVIFADFQCPYCGKVALMLDHLRRINPNQLREVFVNFPMQAHTWARVAARSSECIAKQRIEAFWRFHDLLLSMQSGMTPEAVVSFGDGFAAFDREMDPKAYQNCMASRYPDTRIDFEITSGRSLEVHATPAVFLNGRRYDGFLNEADLANAIKIANNVKRESTKEIKK